MGLGPGVRMSKNKIWLPRAVNEKEGSLSRSRAVSGSRRYP